MSLDIYNIINKNHDSWFLLSLNHTLNLVLISLDFDYIVLFISNITCNDLVNTDKCIINFLFIKINFCDSKWFLSNNIYNFLSNN